MMPERFELTTQERDSAVWKRLKEHINARIEVKRRKNDGALSEVDTARLRGEIAAMKELLGCESGPAITTTD